MLFGTKRFFRLRGIIFTNLYNKYFLISFLNKFKEKKLED